MQFLKPSLALSSLLYAVDAGSLAKRLTPEALLVELTNDINNKCLGNSTCEHEVIASILANPAKPSPAAALGPQCGFPVGDQQLWWDLDVDTWLHDEITHWHNIKREDPTLVSFFKDYFVPKYFDKTSLNQVQCDTLGPCFVSCGDATDGVDESDLHKAWWVVSSTSNGYIGPKAVIDKTASTMGRLAMNHGAIMEGLSNTDEDVKTITSRNDKENLATQMAQDVGLGMMLVSSAFMGPIGGALGGFYAAMNSIVSHQLSYKWKNKDVSHWTHDLGNAFGQDLSDSYGLMMELLVDVATKPIHMTEDGDYSLEQLIGGGKLLGTMHLDANAIEDEAMAFLMARAINYLWTDSRSYIVASDAQTGRCYNDRRGPAWTKVCLPDREDKVFYAYSIPKGWEDDVNNFAQVQVPPGLLSLMDPAANGSYYGVTLEAIVDSSMSYYDQYKNARPAVIAPYDLNNLGEQGLGTRLPSGHLRLTGLINIPVCQNPGGEIITSVDTDKGRNYPCQCGTNDVHHDNKPHFEPSKDESGEFLLATGLSTSKDLEGYCRIQMDCSHDHAWYYRFSKSFPNWNGLFDIPFTKCKRFRPHKVMGHRDEKWYPACDTENWDDTGCNDIWPAEGVNTTENYNSAIEG